MGQRAQVTGDSTYKITVPPTVTASGQTDDFPTGAFDTLEIDVNVTSITGTTPTIQYIYERKGTDGQYYPVWTSASINTTGKTSANPGVGCNPNASVGLSGRLRWVVGGTTPSINHTVSIIGK